ncbi:ATP-binding cassette domain-containing protein [Viridibacillus sp. YIM B01967]|uniref:ABC transporter ATP-binding protein n=1 Tax=Viridibacillus soli TaxID=2798301 RepID=A0ABS1H2S8_9BACL|nr:ATP-binding cassette domain-containing protein [Viridibacillus soli]MBK3493726.1 ATP-binding cassette domain-containing protein [Viridibacillus soli]
MDELFFDIQHLTHCYADGTVALEDLSLSIKKGKKIALLGNNGAGKSTLFQHLNGILEPTSGTIHFKGKQMKYGRKALLELRQQVGIVFQDPDSQLFSGTVRQDISFGPMNLGWSKEKVVKQVEWAMQETEVTSLQQKPIHFLSLGQKKRVAIAGVLAMKPDVFILDEPSAGLDPYYSKQILALLNTIHEEYKTIILSTHDVHFAYEWSDEIIVMSDGKILYHGDPISIFKRPELLKQAHLEKPWIFETAEQLQQNGLLASDAPMPRNKEQLFLQLKQGVTI